MTRTARVSLPCLLALLVSGFLAGCGGGGGGGGAPAGSPPSGAAPAVTVPTATSVDATGATLSGTVTSNGLPTECWFEYGTDPLLGTCSGTARRAVDPAAAGQPVADTVTGLLSETVYFHRLCASNSLGTTRSAIGRFTTSSSHACPDCHGGEDGSLPGVSGAPVVTRYWQTSGHGKGTRGAPLRCDDCHDVASPAGAHAADGSGTFNTLSWPGKPDDTTNANTAHLEGFFFPVSPAAGADYAVAFDNACNNRPGCHVRPDGSRIVAFHQHDKTGNVMEFGLASTAPDPKIYSWYTQSSYADDFYKSQSVWVVRDLTTDAAGPPQYGTCISCHDPHGTGTTDRTSAGGNAMVRGNWQGGVGGEFCAGACHR